MNKYTRPLKSLLPHLDIPKKLPILRHAPEQHQPLAASHRCKAVALSGCGRGTRRPVALPGALPGGELSEVHRVEGVAETAPPCGGPAEDQDAGGVASEGHYRRRMALAP